MSARSNAVIDQRDVLESLKELCGIAALLLDAARYGDVSPSGVRAAARFIETIHGRLEDALDVARWER